MTTKIPLQDNLIIDKNFQSAIRIFNISEIFQNQTQPTLVNQLQYSDTSIGTKPIEVQNSERKGELSTN